jgi:DNA-binding HxlR family transcriptional regulator
MKSYRQTCTVSKALDVLGDRWTLLILRELLLQSPCRYTELANGLPGIASNLLSDRLRTLEEAGLIRREVAPPPVATTLFHLTDKGAATEPILAELSAWGTRHAFELGREDAFREHWVPFGASAFLRHHDPDEPPVTVQLVTPVGSSVIEVDGDGVHPHMGTAEQPDLTLEGMPQVIMGFLSGLLTREESEAKGLKLGGDPAVLDSFHLAEDGNR